MRKIRRTFSFILIISSLLIISTQVFAAAPPPPEESVTTAPLVQEDIDPALVNALNNRVQVMNKSTAEVLAFVIFDTYIDHVVYAEDGQTALLWLGLRDPETGEPIATEPGLAIAKIDSQQKSPLGELSWDVTLQADDDWQTAFSALPDGLLPDEFKERFEEPSLAVTKDVAPVYRGYKLPWAGDTGRYLTGSIGHFLIYNSCLETSCRYAYDFADGTMFPLLAARGGTVYRYNWTCPNGETTCNNYMVLEDRSTSPTTYQLYLHMAYDTIPDKLRKVGAQVLQGQYIGNVDDTGYSSGHHLHFHVHTNPLSYWGNSVDIRFDEVDTNDGTPRTCYEAANWPGYGTECVDDYPGKGDNFYVSENYGAFPPSGNLIMPAPDQVITEGSMLVGGTASDDVGIQKVQTIARPLGSDTWVDIGQPLTVTGTSFLGEVDLCSSGIQPGPLDISVRIFDYEGNLAPGYPGFRTIMNQSACKPVAQPACVPGSNQVALYSGANYQGTCQLFGIGDYKDAASLGSIGDNNVESLLVGSGVRAVLYERDQGDSWSYGRSESFEGNDAMLTDNRVGPNQVSAMRVQSRSTTPGAIVINALVNDTREPLSAEQSYVADFAVYGATEFRAQLSGPVSKTLGWTNHTDWSLGSLSAGNYTLQVWGRNSAGEKTLTKTFTIASGSLPTATTVNAPVSFNFESGTQNWYYIPMWHQETLTRNDVSTKVWVFNDSFDANANADLGHPYVGGGDLTSPPIRIPASGYYLRFDYFAETESPYTFWDTRWVQISKDGGPFENVLQLSYDPTRVWMTSPAINLSAYAGSTIRVRYHMDIVDPYFNAGYLGWVVDNVSINNTAPLSCSDSEPNNRLDQATLFPNNNEVFAYICPNGDLDYYRFSGVAGEELTIDVDAMDFGSQLDPYLFLLDNKGGLLMENDDEVYTVERDSKILYTLPYTGDYYILLKAWKHPGVGDANHFYTLKMYRGDLTPPSIQLLTPSTGLIAREKFDLQASASDTGDGMAAVNFYFRSSDTLNSPWVLLGSDTNGSDGWSASFDPTAYNQVVGGAFYVQAVDNNDNRSGVLREIEGFDETSPISQLAALPSSLGTTAIRLSWTASDPDGDLHHFEIEYQENGSNWQLWRDDIPGSARSAFFIGKLGNSYAFRMQAVDQGLNYEDFPNTAEATTRINDCSKADLFESLSDNSSISAPVLPLEYTQEHNFCPLNDQDWVVFDVEAGTRYLIQASSQSGWAAMNLKLYASDGVTLLANSTSREFGQSTQIVWDAPRDEMLLMQVTPLDPGLAGDAVEYSLWYGEGSFIYMPVINR